MRKSIVTAFMILVACSSMAPSNAAANVAVAVPGSFAAGYATPRLVLHRGAPAIFINLDAAEHDIRSVEKKPNSNQPVWSSAIVGPGGTSPINGLANAAVKDYAFLCVVHTNMTGTATIVG